MSDNHSQVNYLPNIIYNISPTFIIIPESIIIDPSSPYKLHSSPLSYIYFSSLWISYPFSSFDLEYIYNDDTHNTPSFILEGPRVNIYLNHDNRRHFFSMTIDYDWGLFTIKKMADIMNKQKLENKDSCELIFNFLRNIILSEELFQKTRK